MADPVWLLVMFDVPTRTKAQTSAANELRNTLKDRGFSRVQLSVYAKFLSNATAAIPIQKELKYLVPQGGTMRILRIPDRQWAGMLWYENFETLKPEDPPAQLLLF